MSNTPFYIGVVTTPCVNKQVFYLIIEIFLVNQMLKRLCTEKHKNYDLYLNVDIHHLSCCWVER